MPWEGEARATSFALANRMRSLKIESSSKWGEYSSFVQGLLLSSEVRENVSAMSISLTSTFLLVGTSNGMIHLYDLPSHQLLRTISAHKGFSITYLTGLLKPPDLIGHISLDLNVGSLSDAKDVLPPKHVQPFQRMKDAKSREAHEVHILLRPKHNVSHRSPALCSTYLSYAFSHTKTTLSSIAKRSSSEIMHHLYNLQPARRLPLQYPGLNRPPQRTG